jgi:hypothetical protein
MLPQGKPPRGPLLRRNSMPHTHTGTTIHDGNPKRPTMMRAMAKADDRYAAPTLVNRSSSRKLPMKGMRPKTVMATSNQCKTIVSCSRCVMKASQKARLGPAPCTASNSGT